MEFEKNLRPNRSAMNVVLFISFILQNPPYESAHEDELCSRISVSSDETRGLSD